MKRGLLIIGVITLLLLGLFAATYKIETSYCHSFYSKPVDYVPTDTERSTLCRINVVLFGISFIVGYPILSISDSLR